MALITQKDFTSKVGQEKLVQVIHALERKLHELDQKLQDLNQKEIILECDISGYDGREK